MMPNMSCTAEAGVMVIMIVKVVPTRLLSVIIMVSAGYVKSSGMSPILVEIGEKDMALEFATNGLA